MEPLLLGGQKKSGTNTKPVLVPVAGKDLGSNCTHIQSLGFTTTVTFTN